MSFYIDHPRPTNMNPFSSESSETSSTATMPKSISEIEFKNYEDGNSSSSTSSKSTVPVDSEDNHQRDDRRRRWRYLESDYSESDSVNHESNNSSNIRHDDVREKKLRLDSDTDIRVLSSSHFHNKTSSLKRPKSKLKIHYSNHYSMLKLNLVSFFFLLFQFPIALVSAQGFDPQDPCAHERYSNVGAAIPMNDGQSVHVDMIKKNHTHRYQFMTMNTTLMHEKDAFRKLILNLEPCKGVVYLFVRKTRRCYPNPYSCITVGSNQLVSTDTCTWTHFMSVIDGTRDGAPTFFELPLTSTKYYISVYAKEDSSYTLTLLTDVGAFPRPGRAGQLTAMPLQELQIQVGWDVAFYRPTKISETRRYWVYSALLLEGDKRTNANVFLTKNKIMNTVCGLHNNTDRPASTPIPASRCHGGRCNATIDGIVSGKRYIFNVIAESHRGFNMSYAGLILQTEYTVERMATSKKTLQVVGAITGSILGMVIVIYGWMINVYGTK